MLDASEAEVQAAVDHLRSLSLVMETSGGRVMRYSHNVGKVLGLPPQSVALLAVLFLRGAQTPGELRINADRLHRFGDLLAVQAFLDELAERREGALVRELPRAPGARENRWTHLLSGEPQAAPLPATAASSAAVAPDTGSLAARIERLEEDVRELRALVESLRGGARDE